MLEPGMNITFTCKYVLEIYPAEYSGMYSDYSKIVL